METALCCPVCGRPLTFTEKTAFCENRHGYDRAKSGYINLLLSQRSGDRVHGDDIGMVRARKRFLDGGWYLPLAEKVTEMLPKDIPAGLPLLDAGCGEGWYTEKLHAASGRETYGIDISKEAVNLASKRDKDSLYAVASAFSLPFAPDSVGIVTDLFAPLAAAEFLRVTAPGGYLLKVMPDKRHLYELKTAIYDSVYETETDEEVPAGFSLVTKERLSFRIALPDHGTVADLFSMTPYAHNTTSADLKKLDALGGIGTECAFVLMLMKKEEREE